MSDHDQWTADDSRAEVDRDYDLPEAPEYRYHIESGVPRNYAVYDGHTGEVVSRLTTWEAACARVSKLERENERVIIRNGIPGRHDVYRGDRHIGEVRRVEEGYEPRPGRMDSRTVWRAVPLSREAHASSSGCPSYRTRREAADALAAGQVIV